MGTKLYSSQPTWICRHIWGRVALTTVCLNKNRRAILPSELELQIKLLVVIEFQSNIVLETLHYSAIEDFYIWKNVVLLTPS